MVHADERVTVTALADDVHLVGIRSQHPDDRAVRMRVRTEDRVRVVVCATEHLVDRARVRWAGIDRLGLGLLAIHWATLVLPWVGR